jgi:hypothetical protein
MRDKDSPGKTLWGRRNEINEDVTKGKCATAVFKF